MTVLAIVIAGCADHLVGPGPDEPTAPAPQMALVPDAGTARGPLIAEFTIVVPDSGTAEGELILWTPGEMDTTAILEITTDLTLDNRPIPVSDVQRHPLLRSWETASFTHPVLQFCCDFTSFPAGEGLPACCRSSPSSSRSR